MAEETGDRKPATRDIVKEAEKRRALSQLRNRYGEARDLVSGEEPYADLDWILGAKRNPDQRLTDLNEKMIGIIALWLQDLAAEVDRALPQPEGEAGEAFRSADRARQSVATNLRAAAEGFTLAFRRPS